MWRSEAPVRPEAMIAGAGRVCPTTSHRSNETDVLADLLSPHKRPARRLHALASVPDLLQAAGQPRGQPCTPGMLRCQQKARKRATIHVETAPAMVGMSQQRCSGRLTWRPPLSADGGPEDAVVPVAGPFGLHLTCTLPCSMTTMLNVSCC